MTQSDIKADLDKYLESKNRRYCSSCGCTRPADGGAMKKTRGSPRFVCKYCIAKTKMPWPLL